MTDTVAYRHPQLGFEMQLPSASELVEDAPGVALIAMEPEEAGAAFRANIVVTVEEVPTETDVHSYTDESLANQEEALAAFRLIDRARAGLAGAESTRTLGHHNVDGLAVTVEQWRVVVGALGYTVTASCWTLDYDNLADTFSATAATLRPDAEAR